MLCDAFNSLCGMARRLDLVRSGENVFDVAGSQFAVGVLVRMPEATHVLAQRLSTDIENNWRVISQQLWWISRFVIGRTSMHALVIHEIQKIEDEAFSQFSVSRSLLMISSRFLLAVWQLKVTELRFLWQSV